MDSWVSDQLFMSPKTCSIYKRPLTFKKEKHQSLSYKVSYSEVKFRYLGLLKLLVVVRLQFDQRAKDVLVLVGVLIAQQHMLGLLVHSRFLQVFQGGTGVVLEGNKVTATVNKKYITRTITNF